MALLLFPRSSKGKSHSRGVYCVFLLSISLPLIQIRASNYSCDTNRVIVPDSGAAIPAQEDPEVQKLEPDKPAERELAGGESHSYEFALAADQFAKLMIDQRGIDVVVHVLRGDGKQITEIDSESRLRGQESVSLVAEEAGSYRVKVLAKYKDASPGRYEIQLADIHNATERDRALYEASKLSYESRKLYQLGKYNAAQPLTERVLEIRKRILGPKHRDVADTIHNLAAIYWSKGDYAQAEPLLQSSMAIREEVLGPEHPTIATSRHSLGILYSNKGDFAKAELLFRDALAIREKALGPEHPDVATPLTSLGLLHRERDNYRKAEPLLQRALDIRKKALRPDHPELATALSNLAVLHSNKGEYAKAETLFKSALTIWEKAHGLRHYRIAKTLENLGILYFNRGDYKQAESLFLRSLEITEEALGPEHNDVSGVKHNLATLYYYKGDYEKAEPLYRQALDIKKKVLGPDHHTLASSLTNLAVIYIDRKDYAQAEPLLQSALTVRKKVLGPEHPLVAYTLSNLAVLYADKRDYEKAEQYYHLAITILEKALGREHPSVGTAFNDLAGLYAAKRDIAQAIATQSRANAINERNLALNLAIGSERQKLAYLALFSKQTEFTLSLHSESAPNDPQALDMAFTTLLRRKGRGLDAMTDAIATLRRHATPDDQKLFDMLAEARSQLATLIIKESDTAKLDSYQAQVRRLEANIEQLEGELSARSAPFTAQAQVQPVTLSAVRAALPAGSALIEFAVCKPQRFQNRPPRYLAYVLTSEEQPKWVDLGEAARIDRAVDAWRKALRNPNRTDVKQLARKMDEMVMRPIRALLGGTRRLLIAPDGLLNLIPFAALVDEGNKYMIERYSISYLTSGRDLLRVQSTQTNKNPALVLANPVFGRAAIVVAKRTDRTTADSQADNQSQVKIDSTQIFFQPLPSTEDEALAIKAVLPETRVLLREQATETALKQTRSPHILHIATHGFFLSDQEPSPAETRGIQDDNPLGISDMRLSIWAAHVENPLLRSGLALAGANQGKSGEDDGLLTALEAAGLDLWGTKLVVLSACDTGVGEVKNGEGVQGLRRALVLAGSESQVMSLWPVPDQATKDFMIPFYAALQQGQGRCEGLRQVQLRMLRSKDRRHPFYWAAFIQSGEWANLDGQR